MKPTLVPPGDVVSAWRARAWCTALASTLRVQHIRPNGSPYLDRYFVAGWYPGNPKSGPSLFLHHFLASDPSDTVHSHPWEWSASLILVGGYREQRCTSEGTRVEREYRPGELNILLPSDRHRVDLLEADCWTLFLTGTFAQQWGFTPLCGGDQ